MYYLVVKQNKRIKKKINPSQLPQHMHFRCKIIHQEKVQITKKRQNVVQWSMYMIFVEKVTK